MMACSVRVSLVLSVLGLGLSLAYLAYILLGNVTFASATTGPVVVWSALYLLAVTVLGVLNLGGLTYVWRKKVDGYGAAARTFAICAAGVLLVTVFAFWVGEQKVQRSKASDQLLGTADQRSRAP
jgi:hypothetical protein